MDEIKFKVWFEKENQMISWNTLTQSAWNTFRGDKSLSLIYDVLVTRKDEFKKLLFTGFNDENGMEIYVGDFFEGFGDVKYFEVKFEMGEIIVYNNYGKWGTLKRFFEITNQFNIKVLIKGNIYENSDLKS